MLNLENVTLWACVWTPDEDLIDRTFRVVRYCTRVAKFGDVVFFSNKDPGILDDCKWRVVRIPRLDIHKWNVFVNREVPKHIKTDFAMSVHEDGFIIDPSRWSDDFLKYDYIGAPWPTGLVGNQGFCIESKKLLKEKLSLPTTKDEPDIPSDVFICNKNRDRLERKGIKFAPQPVAELFSTEMYGDEKPSFGFHGRTHSLRKYALGWELIRKMESEWSSGIRIAVLTGCLPNYNCLGDRTININKSNYCQRYGYHLEVVRSIRPKFEDLEGHAWGFSWSRLEHMAEMVESGKWDWVWCVGCDTLVTNFGISLESIILESQTESAKKRPMPKCPPFPGSTAPAPVIEWKDDKSSPRFGEKHLIIAGERVTAVQADSFLVKCSNEGSAYLRDILAHYGIYKRHPWVENQVMIDLREKHSAITHIVPQWKLNSYEYSLFYHINPAYRDGTDCYGNRGQWMPGDFLIHWPGVTLKKRMELLKRYEPQVAY